MFVMVCRLTNGELGTCCKIQNSLNFNVASEIRELYQITFLKISHLNVTRETCIVAAIEARFMTSVNRRYFPMRGKTREVGGRNFFTISTRNTIRESSREMPRAIFS
jgi:hypothetical protein